MNQAKQLKIYLHQAGSLQPMSSEDTLARADAMKHLDGRTPMALEHTGPETPPQAENPDSPKRKRRTSEEVAADKALKALEREQAKAQRAREREEAKLARAAERAEAKLQAVRDKITLAEGGTCELPAAVFRSGQVVPLAMADAAAAIGLYLDDLCVDVEHAGYPPGHQLYELRTIQMGGEECAVVLDAADEAQMLLAAEALARARKLRAHSAAADVIPLVQAGLIAWEDAWAKMHDSVLNAKLADPALSGSDADALKELARDLLREYAVSPAAEEAKNELFKAMGCLTKPSLTTPPEKNGWYSVNKNSVVMTRYAGSDVLDLAAVLRILPPAPVAESVIDREREFQAACAPVTWIGFALDAAHIKRKIQEEEAAREQSRENVLVLSDGKITNPKSPDVIKLLPEVIPGIQLGVDRKTKRVSANKGSLEKVAMSDDPLTHHLCKQILAYRHHDTTLGLLLRPLEILCDHGDRRMRPTVYTIEATTGRTSCRRPNGQQFSRQGGVRACVTAGEMVIVVVNGQWMYVDGRTGDRIGLRGISADFEGCEIRVGAGLSGDRALLEAETSLRCYACGTEPPAGESCECGKNHKGLHWMAAHEAFGLEATKEHRYWCKRGIFCKLFGGGPQTAAEQVYAPLEPMQRVFAAFEAIAPVYTNWDRWLRKCYKDGSMVWRDYTTGQNYAQSIDGSKRMIYRAYSGRNIYIGNGEHAAGNGAIQGTAREVLVDGTLNWRKTRWGRLPLLPVHDQIIAFVPAHEAEEATQVLADCMQTSVLSSPGFDVHIGAEVDKPFVSWPDSS